MGDKLWNLSRVLSYQPDNIAVLLNKLYFINSSIGKAKVFGMNTIMRKNSGEYAFEMENYQNV